MAASQRSIQAQLQTCRYIHRRCSPFSTPLRSSTRLSQPHLLSPLPSNLHPPGIRHASHQAQGRANGPKNGAGKRLGAKKTGEQAVTTGSIIFRQRGTKWFPGENCGMGRDHTIFAQQAGFVKYYRDPARHPKRQYIGVVFRREDALPTPANAVTRRRLNMVATTVRNDEGAVGAGEAPGDGVLAVRTKEGAVLRMRPDYSFREGNWEIGRAAERMGVQVRPFVKGDRWLAWRKASARKKRTAEEKAFGKKGKKVKQQKKRTAAVKAYLPRGHVV